LSPREVSKVIREGYESLVLPEVEMKGWDRWREGENKGVVKRWGRVVVEDVRGFGQGWVVGNGNGG